MSIVSKRAIYLDNAASTPVDSRVKKEMAKATELYGNPSSYNNAGREAKKLLEDSRLKVARFIGARPEEIIFTSSGSEANSLAILGLAGPQKGEIITTKIEHLSILESLKSLEGGGVGVNYLGVDREGFISLKELAAKLNPDTRLVSVIYANNEIGTIQDIKKISKIIKQNSSAIFHIDACQATEYLPMNVNELGVDLMTFNGAKVYGPKGVGVLYKKKGINLRPLVYGGGQEYGFRAGTENLPTVAGLAKALSLVDKKEARRISVLRDYFIKSIKVLIPEVRINGPQEEGRLANNINLSIPGPDSENLLLELDKNSIYASSGSACTARSVEPSHVLKAIGVNKAHINGSLRFSLGRGTTKKDIDRVLGILPKVVNSLKYRYNIKSSVPVA